MAGTAVYTIMLVTGLCVGAIGTVCVTVIHSNSGIGHQSAYVQHSQDLVKDFSNAVVTAFWWNLLNSSNAVYSGIPMLW